MPPIIRATVIKDTASPELREMLRKVDPPRPLLSVLGKKLEGVLRTHFREKEAQPEKRAGWPKQHFWSQIRNATAFSGASDSEASVTVADRRFRIRVEGGRIYPKEAKALAVPQVPRVAGIRPSAHLIPGVFLIKGTNKLAVKEGGVLTVLWKLYKSVPHPKDPTALPPEEKVNAELVKTADAFLLKKGLT
jgi:hypothetical protein